MSVGQPAFTLLNRYGIMVRDAFGKMPYHVGSSVKNKTGWRDVDVRVLLEEDEWEREFPGTEPGNPMLNPKWQATCLAWSIFGREYTGLPIDFQLQQRTYANETYSAKDGNVRSAIGIDQREHYSELADQESENAAGER
jgi:hypothetical protein